MEFAHCGLQIDAYYKSSLEDMSYMFTMCARKFQKSNLEGARVRHSMRSSLCYEMDYFIIFNKVVCKASSGNTAKL